MGNDKLFSKRREERKKRKENVEKQRSSNWLVVCEGEQTEPNYFKGAVDAINEGLEDNYKLKVKIVGKGMNTISLVKSVEDLLNDIEHKRGRPKETNIDYKERYEILKNTRNS